MKRVNPGAYRLARACGIRKRKLAVILGFRKLGGRVEKENGEQS